jgi:hypothetical protein
MDKNTCGVAMGICLALVAMGLVKTSERVHRQVKSGDIAQVEPKYKDRCPYYPSPVACSAPTVVGTLLRGGPIAPRPARPAAISVGG